MSKKPNIRSLSAMAFTKMAPAREEIISKSDDEKVKCVNSYRPNVIAGLLHPACQHLVVKEIIEEPSESKSFILGADPESETKTLAYAQAGTYLSFSLTIGSLAITRPYSLASSPKESREGIYRITVKRVGGGLVSNYLLDSWIVGTKVTASAPLGTFTYSPLRDAKTVIGLAGGSGITPFRSFARAIADGDEDFNFILLYGTRTLADAVFESEFAEIAASCPKFKLVNILSDEERPGYVHGFITADLIKQYLPEGEEASLFICGPQAMYRFLEKELPKLGLRPKFIRRDCYGEIHGPEKMSDYPAGSLGEKTFTLTLMQEGVTHEIPCSTEESLLAAIEKAGFAMPSHCRSGICGFCHSRLVKGEVYVPKIVDGRRLADPLYGYIHPCVSFPLSDITLEVPIVK